MQAETYTGPKTLSLSSHNNAKVLDCDAVPGSRAVIEQGRHLLQNLNSEGEFMLSLEEEEERSQVTRVVHLSRVWDTEHDFLILIALTC